MKQVLVVVILPWKRLVVVAFLLGLAMVLLSSPAAAQKAPELPSNVNWVTRGAVLPVKNQGQCGGDYAFATAGAVGSLEAIFGKGLADVSVQQLLDCTSAYGANGCWGASLGSAFRYIAANGVTITDAYPYTGQGHRQPNDPMPTCKVNGGAIKIKSYTEVPRGDCQSS